MTHAERGPARFGEIGGSEELEVCPSSFEGRSGNRELSNIRNGMTKKQQPRR